MLRREFWGWQFKHMVGQGDVLRWRGDLNHLGARRTLEHPVPNQGRLQHTIARVHVEGLALPFVNHAHPAFAAKNCLKTNLVEVHIICHRPALEHPDMGRDESAAMALGQEVTVKQSGPAHLPAVRVIRPGDDQGLAGRRQSHRRISFHQPNQHPIGRRERGLPPSRQ